MQNPKSGESAGAPPVISVALITYNHAAFIAKALESVIAQVTDFAFEVVIGEDCSTDGTREIVRRYAEAHPGVIRPLFHERNMGGRRNASTVLGACRGKYIAMLDGDDYWTSKDKLQKQVDFLESHGECTLCFTNVMVIDERSGQAPAPAYGRYEMRSSYGLADLLERNFIHTASVVLRACALPRPLPEWHFRMPMGDRPLFLMCAAQGRLGYLPEVLAAYRLHAGGVWSGLRGVEHMRKMALAVEIVQKDFLTALPDGARYKATLSRQAFHLYSALGEHRPAARHARLLLLHAPGGCVRYLRPLLSMILRVHCAGLSRALRAIRVRWGRARGAKAQAADTSRSNTS